MIYSSLDLNWCMFYYGHIPTGISWVRRKGRLHEILLDRRVMNEMTDYTTLE